MDCELFADSGQFNFVAGADYFPEKVKEFGEKFGVAADKRFTGLSGYKKLLEQKLDAVVIESPPYFHPEHAAAAVDAGKHVYLAKPIAVDVPGCRSIQASAKKATANKLCFLVDFQTRAHPSYQRGGEACSIRPDRQADFTLTTMSPARRGMTWTARCARNRMIRK